MFARVLPLLLATALAGPLHAQDLAAPTGEVLLTVTGDIARTNGKDAARFDLAMLEEMETRTFTTHTIWTDGEQTFTGVPLTALLGRLEAEADTIKAVAINDYAVEIPASDWEGAEGPIVAYLNNGAPMSVRNKGPLWIVYPYDSDPAYQTEQVYARSIWQLDAIQVGTE